MKIKKEQINALAEPRYIERGEAIYKNNMVDLVYVSENQVDAIVVGNDVYETRLFKTEKGELTGKCTCLASKQEPCKHMTAVAFSVSDQGYQPSATLAYDKERIEERKNRLLQRNNEELVARILELEQKIDELKNK